MAQPVLYADPVLQQLAGEVRARFRRVTPYRLGCAVGRAGLDIPAPYAPGSRAARLYRDGITWARAWQEQQRLELEGEGIGHE